MLLLLHTLEQRSKKLLREMLERKTLHVPFRLGQRSVTEELLDHGGDFLCAGDEEQMPVVDYMQRRVRDACCKNLGIDQGDDRVVVTVYHKCRLAQTAEPRKAAKTPMASS